ncbi:hypothetical protein SCLCIDRAFT_33547 [Scleroderma citrinum Foug A]|uniref:Uncharacterized protein n=1 Tax=Scleroderma citrinum Foug A TaxID=1036808 RepID=A0A0C3D5C0_9AGAM|nr:hypothetical protein SCLCIDRAFT_33547 [Scleroderma citrinum Foug A]
MAEARSPGKRGDYPNPSPWIPLDPVDVLHHMAELKDRSKWTDLHVEGISDGNRDMRGLMLRRLQSTTYPLLVDGVLTELFHAPYGKDECGCLHLLLQSYENSWGISVTSATQTTSTAKETFLITVLQMGTSAQSSIE